ncbi:MAG: metal-binding protein [Betaproteobacteria bacterium]|nr:metal-binding protein [Betaproteobacteria bacterium]
MLRSLVFALALTATASARAQVSLPPVEVYGPAVCLVCLDWTEHLRENGFKARYHAVEDLAAVKRRWRVPEALAGRFTATVGGYFIEGHVPAEDLKALLKEKPKARGLAVPGQPRGAPGLEKFSPYCERGCTILDNEAGEAVVRRELFDTLLVDRRGKTRIWARH